MSSSVSGMSQSSSLLFGPESHFSLPYIADGKLSFVSVLKTQAQQIRDSAPSDAPIKKVAEMVLQGCGRVDATIMAVRDAYSKLDQIVSPRDRLEAELELRNFVLRVGRRVEQKLDWQSSIFISGILGGLGSLSRVENTLNARIEVDTKNAQALQIDCFKPYCHIMSPVDAVTALKNEQVAPQNTKGFILRMDPHDPAVIHLVERVKRPTGFEVRESTILCMNGTYRLMLDDHDPQHQAFQGLDQWRDPFALMSALKARYGEPISLSSSSTVASVAPVEALPAAPIVSAADSRAPVVDPAPLLSAAPAASIAVEPVASAPIVPPPALSVNKDPLVGSQLDKLLSQLPKGLCKTRSKEKAVESISGKMRLAFEKEGGVGMLQYDAPPHSSNNKAFTLRREGNAIFLVAATVDLESRAVQTSELDVTSVLILDGVPEDEAPSIGSFVQSLSEEHGVPVTSKFTTELQRRVRKTAVVQPQPVQPILQAMHVASTTTAATLSSSTVPIVAPVPKREEERIGGCLIQSGLDKEDLEFLLKVYERRPSKDVTKAFVLYREKGSRDNSLICVKTASYGAHGKATISTITPQIRLAKSGAYTLSFEESELGDTTRNLMFTNAETLVAELKLRWGQSIEC